MPEKTMTALVKTAKGKGLIELKKVPIPEIAGDEVLIEVKAAGICGTDLHIYHDEFPYWPPVILGHEFAGVIARVGKNIEDWKPGDRVVGEPHTMACGKCWLCRMGNRQLCPSKRSPGWGIDGCFARFMRYPEPALLHRLPDGLAFEEAVFVEPAANVVHDVLERARVEPADVVAVIGPGPIGFMAAMAVKASGASKVFLLGTAMDEEVRLPAARKNPAIDCVWNVQKVDVVSRIMNLSEGRGADLVVEASGTEAGIGLGLELVRKMGRFSAIGLTARDKIPFPYDTAMFKSVDFFFNLSTSYSSWDRAISLIASKKIDVKPLVTHKGRLDRWAEFFAALDGKKGIKGIFLP
jgi:L-iditol 2-dehydrogenase